MQDRVLLLKYVAGKVIAENTDFFECFSTSLVPIESRISLFHKQFLVVDTVDDDVIVVPALFFHLMNVYPVLVGVHSVP